ncbi:MAG: TerB family tellurite resistance protein [Pseudomonadota bacterium]
MSTLKDIGNALAGLFGGGKPDPERQMHLEVLFGLLGYVAKLDSIITSHEAEFINELMDQLKLSMNERKVAMAATQKGRAREIDIAVEFGRFSAVHPPGSAESEQLYSALVQLAAADERLRPKERLFLEVATEKLGYRAEELDRRLNAFQLK